MKSLISLVVLAYCSDAFALNDNVLESWYSPNGKYAIRERFYGQGKRVDADFINLATGRTAPAYWTGARSLSVIWSQDSRFVAVSADVSHHFGNMRLFEIKRERINEISLPPNMAAINFISDHAKANLGHTSFDAISTVKWINNAQLEIVSETEACLMNGAGDAEYVSEHFIIDLNNGEAKIIKQFSGKG
jgi:hypothetical protein